MYLFEEDVADNVTVFSFGGNLGCSRFETIEKVFIASAMSHSVRPDEEESYLGRKCCQLPNCLNWLMNLMKLPLLVCQSVRSSNATDCNYCIIYVYKTFIYLFMFIIHSYDSES